MYLSSEDTCLLFNLQIMFLLYALSSQKYITTTYFLDDSENSNRS